MKPESASPPAFAATRWTLILRARGETPESKAALSELCESYYEPILRFLRREGRDQDTARELAQEFFARILSRDGFGQADPERGRFRSYLLGALKHFLLDQRKREQRVKRGGEAELESMDATGADGESAQLQVEDASVVAPDALFDRDWALAVMARGLEVLQKDFAGSGKAEQFEALKPWLMGEAPTMSQGDVGRQLGLSEGAVKVVIHRLRKRFRDAVRTEIAQTLKDPVLVDEELRHLIEVLT